MSDKIVLNVEKRGAEKNSDALRYICISSLMSLVISLIIILPVIYTQFEKKSDSNDSCTDRTSHMIIVTNTMLRSWGENDKASYFQWADPST
jgi:hypothetical protein